MKDFFLTDNYVLRLRPQAIKKLLEELRFSINSRVKYKEKNYSWDIILQLKVNELARYILDKVKQFSFIEPIPEFQNKDIKELREKILNLTVSEAKNIGINKSTLWYIQKRAKSVEPLRFSKKVKNRIYKR